MEKSRTRIKALLTALLMVSLPFIGLAQQADKEKVVQEALKEAGENTGADIDLEELEYRLSDFFDHPLDLNKADRNALRNLGLLTTLQIESLLVHREKYGSFISIYELEAVQGMDMISIRRILPFVIVEESPGQKPLANNWQHNELLLQYGQRMEREAGYSYPNPKYRYAGSPFALGLRYRYRTEKGFAVSFIADKDAGEQLFKGSQKQGFDFYSGNISYSGGKHLRSWVLGDYQAQFGQGLVCWTSMNFGKTADVLRIARSARGINPSHSPSEYLFFRGAAATFDWGKLSFSPFLSYRKLDGSGRPDSAGYEEGALASWLSSGYHRNAAELLKRHTLEEQLAGAAMVYRNGHFHAGLTALAGRYNFNDSTHLADTLLKQNGYSFMSIGANYAWQCRNMYVFGEAAMNGKFAISTVQGLLISLHSRLDVGLLYRNFSAAYINPYASTFGENRNGRNEDGMYAAINYSLLPAWRLNAYADLFSFPRPKYRVDAPSRGYDYLADLQYAPSKRVNFFIRYRESRHEQNVLIPADKTADILPANNRHVRLNLVYKLSQRMEVESRAEFSHYRRLGQPAEQGFLAYQDVRYTLSKLPLQLSARYTFFDIESYNARIYTFEEDIKFSFSAPAFQDIGSRFFLMAQYRSRKGVIIAARLARTVLFDMASFGSGTDAIPVPHRTDLKLQIRYSF